MFDTRMILLEEIISRSLTRVGLKFDGWPKMFSILTVSEKLTFFFLLSSLFSCNRSICFGTSVGLHMGNFDFYLFLFLYAAVSPAVRNGKLWALKENESILGFPIARLISEWPLSTVLVEALKQKRLEKQARKTVYREKKVVAKAYISPCTLTMLVPWLIQIDYDTFWSQDLISDSPYCLPYNSYDVSLENLVRICLLDLVLIS